MADKDAVQELLYVKYVKSTKEKVDRVQFHPVQPWLAFVDRSNDVTVWNYESNEARHCHPAVAPPLPLRHRARGAHVAHAARPRRRPLTLPTRAAPAGYL
jgi:hypothetical protein